MAFLHTGPFGKPELIHLLGAYHVWGKPFDIKLRKGKNLDQVVDGLLDVPQAAPEPPIRAYQGKATTTFDWLDRCFLDPPG